MVVQILVRWTRVGGRTVDEGANTQQEQLAAAVAKGPKSVRFLFSKKDVCKLANLKKG